MYKELLRLAKPVASTRRSVSAESGETRLGAAELDGLLHAMQGQASGGLSLTAQRLAFLDWAIHMTNAPFQRAELAKAAVNQWARLAGAAKGKAAIVPSPTEHRFHDTA